MSVFALVVVVVVTAAAAAALEVFGFYVVVVWWPVQVVEVKFAWIVEVGTLLPMWLWQMKKFFVDKD